MKNDFRDTLLLAFEKELITAPAPGEKWLVLNGRVLPSDPFNGADVVFEQGFRPEYLALERAGFNVIPSLGEIDGKLDHAIVFASRVRSVNEANFLRALERVAPGGTVIVAGDKTSGIAPLRKWAADRASLIDSYSKHHAVVFWCVPGGQGSTAPARAKTSANTGPVFSSDGPDKGSALLASFFDKRIKGKVADFGAGTGYLVEQMLANCPAIESIDLMEAEWSALEQAKTLLAASSVPLEYLWIDITSELRKKPYEWIVMNPPFHHGLHGERRTDPELGKRFIQQAASTLIQGGRLLMVANRNLPYEDTLNAAFRKVTKLADENGYKVFEAVR